MMPANETTATTAPTVHRRPRRVSMNTDPSERNAREANHDQRNREMHAGRERDQETQRSDHKPPAKTGRNPPLPTATGRFIGLPP